MEHFDGHDFIYYSEEDSYRRQVDMLFEAASVKRRLLIETTTATSIGSLVGAGMGISIVNPLTALAFEGPDVAIRPLAYPVAYHVNVWQPEPSRRGLFGEHLVNAIIKTIDCAVSELCARRLCNR